MNILQYGQALTAAVEALVKRARRFFYEVMLSDKACPRCDGGLAMIGESRCRCVSCGHTFDPTAAFQKCVACGGTPALSVRRYRCRDCGADVASRYVFDGLVFDAEYFRRKVAESRERKRQRREALSQARMANGSETLEPGPADLGCMPGLVDALNSLTSGPAISFVLSHPKGFDLKRYERHIQAHIGLIETSFDRIPPLVHNARLDRIWRFVAMIFLQHAGWLDVSQVGDRILVARHEAH